MIRLPFSRTLEGLVNANRRRRILSASLAADGYVFSPFRFNMILGEEAEWTRFYLPVDVRGKVVLDVGAGQGETARLFLKHGARRVVCVEPELESYRYLAANAARHGGVLVAVCGRFNVGMVWQYRPDFVKVDIEGYEECLLGVVLPCPAVVEVHGLQLRDRFRAAGWRVVYPDVGVERGFGCTCYAYWRC